MRPSKLLGYVESAMCVTLARANSLRAAGLYARGRHRVISDGIW